MLKPKKKITKKEMKKDALLTAYEQTLFFYEQNKKMIQYALTALVVIVIAFVVYTNNRRTNDEKAAAELGKVFPVFDAGASDVRQYKTAIDGQPERGIMGLKAIVDNYGGTASGEIARFYLATAYLNLGEYDDAIRQFKNFSGSGKLLKAAAQAGLGAGYEAKGEYRLAGASYEQAAATGDVTATIPQYLSAAGRCYGLAGEKEKAVSLFKRLQREYPTSSYARDAERYLVQYTT